MKKILSGVFCLGMLSIVALPAHAQEPSYRNESVKELEFKSDLTEDAALEAEDDFKVLEQSHTYRLSALDSRSTGKAIAWEQIKQSLLDELMVLMKDRADRKKDQSSKSATKSASVSYGAIANSKEVRAILPSIVLLEQTGEAWAENALSLKAKMVVSPVHVASAVSMIQEKQRVLNEISRVRSLAAAAMADIKRLQKAAAASAEPARQNQNYLDAANRLAAADRYESARYHELVNRPQEAIDAYTEAIEFLPELAPAYWNRGRLHLSHLGDRTKAASDFNAALQAYSSNAASHMRSGKYQECLDAIGAALTLNAKFAKAYYQRAACRTGLGKQDGVREDFIRAAQLGDKSAQDLLTARGITW